MTETGAPPPDPNNANDRVGFVRLRDTSRALQQTSNYTKRVWILRRALPVLVFIVLGALVIWPILTQTKLSETALQNTPNLMIDNLHYTGIDAEGQAYSVTAKRALQGGGGKGLVDLEAPEAEITLHSGAWLVVHASYGRFDQNTKMLWLGGDVRFYHDSGDQVITSDAQIDIAGGRAWGHEPIMIQGPFGEIRGKSWRLLDKEHTFIIDGPATAHLVALAQDLQGDASFGKKADR